MECAQNSEFLTCVDESNCLLEPVPRYICHGDPRHLHRVVHVIVLNSRQEILLQKRSRKKLIQPGKWDTAVGGHVDPGENFREAAAREFHEELGRYPENLDFLYEYIWLSDMESEWVQTFLSRSDAGFSIDPEESEDLAFFSLDALNGLSENGTLTPNARYESWCLMRHLSDPDFSPDFFYPIRSICNCKKCPRLARYRSTISPRSSKTTPEKYWNNPVPGWGDPTATLLVIGLAPGAHGANRTGRVFTGDFAGDILFKALYEIGLCNKPNASFRGDGLELTDVFITNAVKCVPPQNRPTSLEIKNCRPFLLKEMRILSQIRGIITLGRIAFTTLTETYRFLDVDFPRIPFEHGRIFSPEGLPELMASYHPSRRNINTGIMTYSDFKTILSGFYRHLKK